MGKGWTLVFDGNGSAEQVSEWVKICWSIIQPTDNHLSGGSVILSIRLVVAIIRFIPAELLFLFMLNRKQIPSDSGKDRIWAGQSAWWEWERLLLPCGLRKIRRQA